MAGAEVPIRILLPAILRLFPQLARTVLTRGKVVPINSVDPMSETELARRLDQRTKLREKKGFNDNAHVVKVSDVKKCIEEKLDKSVLRDVIIRGAQIILLGGEAVGDDQTPGELIGNKIMECIREKILAQTAARKRITYRYSKRAI